MVDRVYRQRLSQTRAGFYRVICVHLKLIAPGSPTQNAFIENFNGKFRDECLNNHWLETLHASRAIITA